MHVVEAGQLQEGGAFEQLDAADDRGPGPRDDARGIARIYAQMARTAGRDGGGIGLDLLARICGHLGWELRLDSEPDRGTTTVLRLR